MAKSRSRRRGTARRSREEWTRLMAAYEAGELTQRAFCAERGLAYSTFCYWRRRLGEERSVAGEAPMLVELPVAAGAGDWRVELDLGDGLVLRLK